MSVKVDQAFVDAFINGNFGIGIAYENIDYTPTPEEPYAELINLPNDTTAFSLNDSDETDGIFRILLNWPFNKGAIAPKQKADEVLNAFKIGTKVCYSGQCATVTRASRYQGVSNDGWYQLVLTVGYYANILR